MSNITVCWAGNETGKRKDMCLDRTFVLSFCCDESRDVLRKRQYQSTDGKSVAVQADTSW